MYKNFEMLAVADEQDLRDPARLRRIYWGNNYGLYIAAAGCGLAGLALLALAAWPVYFKIGGGDMPAGVLWSLFGTGAGGAMMTLWMSHMFRKEIRFNPIGAYLRDQASCIFSEGRIEEVSYLSDGNRSGARASVKGSFGESGLFYEDFLPGLWSRAVADNGEEEGLKPGDDWYAEKGKRVRLPIRVWIIAKRESPRLGVLAGIPAETVRLLSRGKSLRPESK